MAGSGARVRGARSETEVLTLLKLGREVRTNLAPVAVALRLAFPLLARRRRAAPRAERRLPRDPPPVFFFLFLGQCMGGDGPGEGTPRAFASQASHTNHADVPSRRYVRGAVARARDVRQDAARVALDPAERQKREAQHVFSRASENVFSPDAAFVFVSTAFAETARRSASVVPSLAHATPPDTPKPLDANGAVRLAGFAGAATAPRVERADAAARLRFFLFCF